MSNKARNYSISTIKKLYNFANNKCAFPNCTKSLVAEDGETMIGQIAHIQAANEGGARYYPIISDKERAGFPNLMLLCDEHHKMIDNKANEEKYTIELLKKWKAEHEAKHENDNYQVPDTIIEQITIQLENYLKNLTEKFIKENIEANRTILDEIFDYIYKEKIDEEKIKIKFEQDSISITKKIMINFENNQQKRVNQIVSDYFKYEYIIRKFIEIEKLENPLRVDGLRDKIQDLYCNIQNTENTETRIKDFNVFTGIAKELLPLNKQHDTSYVFNAKLIVLYFFEFCEIGKKSDDRANNNQLKLDL